MVLREPKHVRLCGMIRPLGIPPVQFVWLVVLLNFLSKKKRFVSPTAQRVTTIPTR